MLLEKLSSLQSSSSSSYHRTILFHSSAHCFPTSLNIIRSSKEQGCANWDTVTYVPWFLLLFHSSTMILRLGQYNIRIYRSILFLVEFNIFLLLHSYISSYTQSSILYICLLYLFASYGYCSKGLFCTSVCACALCNSVTSVKFSTILPPHQTTH